MTTPFRVWLTVCLLALALPSGPARAAVVFSNYNGFDCRCGLTGNATLAMSFVPSGNFEVTGVSILLANRSSNPGNVNLWIYDSVGGKPNAIVGELGFVEPNPSNNSTSIMALETLTYTGPTITLSEGTPYFLAAALTTGVAWRGQGSPTRTLSFLFDTGWTDPSTSSLQFQVFGTEVVNAPEPASMLLLGAGLFGLAVRRRQG